MSGRSERGRSVIQTSGLTRRFGPIVAVDRLELRVERQSVYGFLGPNGAGVCVKSPVLYRIGRVIVLVHREASWTTFGSCVI